MGDIVDSGIRFSYRPASLCSLAGRYDNLMLKSTLSPKPGTKNLVTGEHNENILVWKMEGHEPDFY